MELSSEQEKKALEVLTEGYENINYFTNEQFILRMLLINPDGMLILDFNPFQGTTDSTDIMGLVREADADQLAAFISSIFKQSYDLSIKTTKLKVQRHDLVTQEGVTIALYGIISDVENVEDETDRIKGFLGIWIDPRKGEDVIFRKGALKLVYKLNNIL